MSKQTILRRARLFQESTAAMTAFVYDNILEGDDAGSARLPWVIAAGDRVEKMQQHMLMLQAAIEEEEASPSNPARVAGSGT